MSYLGILASEGLLYCSWVALVSKLCLPFSQHVIHLVNKDINNEKLVWGKNNIQMYMTIVLAVKLLSYKTWHDSCPFCNSFSVRVLSIACKKNTRFRYYHFMLKAKLGLLKQQNYSRCKWFKMLKENRTIYHKRMSITAHTEKFKRIFCLVKLTNHAAQFCFEWSRTASNKCRLQKCVFSVTLPVNL